SFYKEAKKQGIKPILGVEAYICENIENRNRKQNHITLLAKSYKGVRTLNKLMTIANTKGFFYYPRIDPQILLAHREDIMVLSGCLGGLWSQWFLKGEADTAYTMAKIFQYAFGPDFYIEIQDSGIDEQKIVKPLLRELADKLSIRTVASNDAHYTTAKDAETHEIILTAGQRRRLSDPVRGYDDFSGEDNLPTRWRFESVDYYIKDREELSAIYTETELDNTIDVARKCAIEFPPKSAHIPTFSTPDGSTEYDYLRSVCSENWYKLGLDKKSNVKDYQERIRKELSDIKDGNLAGYFLIVWDVCKFADDVKICRGDGRGSAVGSLVSYVLGIHNCDPIQYKLIWERFYNIARKGSLPDIDLDFETERREEVIEYVRNKYGENKVFQFITYDTFRMKNAIKDIGRVMGMSLEEAQEISNCVPFKYESFEDAMTQSEELRNYAQKYPDLFRHVARVEDVKKAKSSHASAVLICDEDVIESGCIPLSYDAKNKKFVTGLDMYTLDDLGYLKLDILGLKTVSVLQEVEKLVNGAA
ncbi:MAG: DNA polymerase III subunit alpha, partial [Nitrososphaera sp.]|nr:DNA polymerase III subunit alpha [Nitrososphaera sp.]